MVPWVIEPELFDMDATSIIHVQPEEYCARVLAKICQAALQNLNSMPSMLVNYRQLPQVVWSSILDFFDMRYTSIDVDRMRTAAQFDSKNPKLYFENATTSKRCEASDLVYEISSRWVVPVYEELEARRLAQST